MFPRLPPGYASSDEEEEEDEDGPPSSDDEEPEEHPMEVDDHVPVLPILPAINLPHLD